jgi:hypothetical protein
MLSYSAIEFIEIDCVLCVSCFLIMINSLIFLILNTIAILIDLFYAKSSRDSYKVTLCLIG